MALRSPAPSSQSAASGRRRRGFAGDFLPVARAHAAVAECVISHPNVLNAGNLRCPARSTLRDTPLTDLQKALGISDHFTTTCCFNLGRLGVGFWNRGGASTPPLACCRCCESFSRVQCHRCSFGDQDIV